MKIRKRCRLFNKPGMKNLLSNGLIICVLIVPSLEKFFFNFRTQYDGQIYPKWIKSKFSKTNLYQSAVVVSNNFIILGDGIDKPDGLSGIYSTSQCLSIARLFLISKETSYTDLYREVKLNLSGGSKEFNVPNTERFKAEIGTTLLYVKIEGTRLLAGVIGDSSIFVFRFDPDAGIMKLIFQSRETVREFNNPNFISPSHIESGNIYDIEIEEGDVVMAVSVGVTNVLSTPFIIAAMNFLMNRMIEKVNVEKKHIDSIDYDYDLGNFVEAYLQNLHELSLKLLRTIDTRLKAVNYHKVEFHQDEKLEDRSKIQKEKKNPFQEQQEQQEQKNFNSYRSVDSFDDEDEVNDENKPIFKIPDLMSFDLGEMGSDDELGLKVPIFDRTNERSQINNANQQQNQIIANNQAKANQLISHRSSQTLNLSSYDSEKQQKDQEIEMIKANAKTMRNEICNNLDPRRSSQNHLKIIHSDDFKDLTIKEVGGKKVVEMQGVDCFTKNNITKTTTYITNQTEWNCDHILDLTSPIYPVINTKKKFPLHNLHKCVIDATPKLPQGIQPKDIPKYFNPRLVSRSFKIARKYISRNIRFIVSMFVLKSFYNKDKGTAFFPETADGYKKVNWNTPNDDYTIAAAAISSKDIFQKANNNQENSLVEILQAHETEQIKFYQEIYLRANKMAKVEI